MSDISITDSPRLDEYRQLRLKALQNDPVAFSTTLEEAANYPESKWQGYLDKGKARDGSVTLFARVDGEIVGMVGAMWETSRKVKHSAYVFGMFVDPKLRGRKIATTLMETLFEELQKIGGFRKMKLEVVSEQTAAVALYEKLGFVKTGESKEDLLEGNKYYDVTIMEKYF